MPVVNGLYYSFHNGGPPQLPPVVLIHGAGGDHLGWPVQLRRLIGQRVLAPDLSGHGRSEGFACQSITDYSQQIMNFMNALDIYKVILVGHSMGGAVAMQTALQIPHQVLGLGLISTASRLDIVPDLLDDLQAKVPLGSVLHKLHDRLYSPHTDPQMARKGIERLSQVRPTALYADWLACHKFDIESKLNKIKTPTWITVGKEDRLTTIDRVKRLADQLPNNIFNVIPNAGHMVILEQAEPLVQSLSEFINNLERPKRYAWQHP